VGARRGEPDWLFLLPVRSSAGRRLSAEGMLRGRTAPDGGGRLRGGRGLPCVRGRSMEHDVTSTSSRR